MKKNIVKVSENTLRKIVAESVKKVLCEWWDEDGDWVGGIEDAEEEAQANRDMRNYNRRGRYSHEQGKDDGIQFELNTICEKIKAEFGVDGTIRMDGNDISLVFSGEKSDFHEGIYMSKFQIELLYRIFKECDALGEKMGADTPIYVLPNGMISVYFV